MSKRESIARYSLIIKKLRKFPASYEEIADYLELESEIQGYNYNISKRTFQRDLNDILSLYSIEIKIDKRTGKYRIVTSDLPDVNRRIMEAFDTFNALNIADRLSDHIHFESRKPLGTEHLYGLLHAIKNNLRVEFKYEKYYEGVFTQRMVEPYALKEFKNRWYLLANDLKDSSIKSFALDRMQDLEILKTKFEPAAAFDVNEHYKNCFGIVSPNAKEPSRIVLSFNPFQGKYIKSLPLHHTQKTVIDNDHELRVEFWVYITHDLVMEILSYGDNVKVIEPKELIDEVKNILTDALENY